VVLLPPPEVVPVGELEEQAAPVAVSTPRDTEQNKVLRDMAFSIAA